MEKKIKLTNFEQTIDLGFKIAKLLSNGDIILLSGDIGSGKTTFTKGIGKALGITTNIKSPTFTIVKEYNSNIPLYHLDLYRLTEGFNEFDLDEYMYSNGICVIEWPYIATNELPDEYILIEIENLFDEGRIFTIKGIGDKYKKLVGNLDVHFNN